MSTDYQQIPEDKGHHEFHQGGYQGYQAGGYPPAGGGFGGQPPMMGEAAGFVVGAHEQSGLLEHQHHGGYQGFGNSDEMNKVLEDNKAALAIYYFFVDLNRKVNRVMWAWPIFLTAVQLLGIILVMVTGKTTLLYIVGGIGLAPCIGGMFAYYFSPSIPTTTCARDTTANVVIYDVKYSNGNFLWDCVKFLHMFFSFLITFASGIGGAVGAALSFADPGPLTDYGYDAGSYSFSTSGTGGDGLDTNSALGICWFILSVTTYGLYLHYNRSELLFQFIWQKIKRTTLLEALRSNQSDENLRHGLMTLLKVNPQFNYIYEPAARAPPGEEISLPGVNDEQSAEIYVNPSACCGCIQDGEYILDVNKNRMTEAGVTGCYPSCGGRINYTTMWFEHLPSVSFDSVDSFLNCGVATWGKLLLACITCIPWIFLCSCFCQVDRRMLMRAGDPSMNAVEFLVFLPHVASIRNIVVRAIGAWRNRRFGNPQPLQHV